MLSQWSIGILAIGVITGINIIFSGMALTWLALTVREA